MSETLSVLREALEERSRRTFDALEAHVRGRIPDVVARRGDWKNVNIPFVYYLSFRPNTDPASESLDVVVTLHKEEGHYLLKAHASWSSGDLVFETGQLEIPWNQEHLLEVIERDLDRVFGEIVEEEEKIFHAIDGS